VLLFDALAGIFAGAIGPQLAGQSAVASHSTCCGRSGAGPFAARGSGKLARRSLQACAPQNHPPKVGGKPESKWLRSLLAINQEKMKKKSLIVGTVQALLLCNLNAWAVQAAERVNIPKLLDRVSVKGAKTADPLMPSVMPQVEDGKILLGKKTNVIDLSQQPSISNSNPRELFARAPGIFVSEQYGQGQWNLGYRGLGDPHESEFFSVLMNGVPIMSDWMTYNTLLWAPPLQRMAEVEVIHGGSGLLYGPQPGPVVNFVMRRPEPNAPLSRRADLSFGSYGFKGNYNELAAGSERFGFLVSTDYRENDGERVRGGSRVKSVMASAIFQESEDAFWTLDVNGFQSFNNEAGRLTFAQWSANPDLSIRPFDDFRVQRFQGVLSHERALNDFTVLDVKAWAGYHDRWSRRAGTVLSGQPRPGFTTFDRQQFQFAGIDARIRVDWGQNHTLTTGAVVYNSDSPRSQGRASDLQAPSQTSIRFLQERDSQYRAVFAENAFRFGAFSLVPALRLEKIKLGVDEEIKLSTLRRQPIRRDFDRDVALFGFGGIWDASANLQGYANFSEGYRPMRFDDVANPASELAVNNDPAVSDSQTSEIGMRGTPMIGLTFDASVFQIDFEDKIEQRIVGVSDIERINSGDARHRGLDLAVDYNWFASSQRDDRLTTFFSNTWLDAEIVRSVTPVAIGKRPQFTPSHLSRAGVAYQSGSGWKAMLSGSFVASQFWQDSNLARGDLPARMPSYRVYDLSIEVPVHEAVMLTGGVNNFSNETYYSRIRSDGIEPAPGRSGFIGVSVRW